MYCLRWTHVACQYVGEAEGNTVSYFVLGVDGSDGRSRLTGTLGSARSGARLDCFANVVTFGVVVHPVHHAPVIGNVWIVRAAAVVLCILARVAGWYFSGGCAEGVTRQQ